MPEIFQLYFESKSVIRMMFLLFDGLNMHIGNGIFGPFTKKKQYIVLWFNIPSWPELLRLVSLFR